MPAYLYGGGGYLILRQIELQRNRKRAMRDENTPGTDAKTFVQKNRDAAAAQDLSEAVAEFNAKVAEIRKTHTVTIRTSNGDYASAIVKAAIDVGVEKTRG